MTRSLGTRPHRGAALMIIIAPSLLAADFARLGAALKFIKEAGATMIHVDVMDGHLVPRAHRGPTGHQERAPGHRSGPRYSSLDRTAGAIRRASLSRSARRPGGHSRGSQRRTCAELCAKFGERRAGGNWVWRSILPRRSNPWPTYWEDRLPADSRVRRGIRERRLISRRTLC